MIYTLTLNPNLDITIETGNISRENINKTVVRSISIGGKGINISRALTCLNIDNKAVTVIGGKFKDSIIKILKDEGIKSDLISIKNSVRINIKLIENKSKKLIEFNEIGPEIYSDEVENIFDSIKKIPPGTRYFALAGSLPLNMDKKIYKELILLLKSKKIKVLLDTTGEPLFNGLSAVPDILKINFREFGELCSKYYGKSPDEIIKKLISDGVEIIMITNGKKETLFYSKKNYFILKPSKLESLYTTGCGDSVSAGLLYSLSNNLNTEDSIRFAAACGEANLLTKTPGMINIDAVKSIIDQIKILKQRVS